MPPASPRYPAVLLLSGAPGEGDPGDALWKDLPTLGIDVESVESLGELLERLQSRKWTATVLSLSSGELDEAIGSRVAAHENAGSLLLSAPKVTLEDALFMERVGAVGVLREPVDPVELASRVKLLVQRGDAMSLPPPDDSALRLVGSSPALGGLLETLARVAPSTVTVLVTGESGTGKELVARSLHLASPRRSGSFVAVNCAAIPEQLLESELFGHERGAFTGAVARRLGRFEKATGGTLFLDEIGDMSGVLQAKILRALEEGAVTRVGGDEPVSIDVRVVAATNRDLKTMVESGDFREDLYHRLAVVELHLPPLRERGSDLPELALHFAARAAAKHGRRIGAVSVDAIRRLEAYPWPGNVRELRNVMDRAVLLASGRTVLPGDLLLGANAPHGAPRVTGSTGVGYPPTLSLADAEAEHIRSVLAHLDGHIGKAAETLGIHRNTLARKIQEYGIKP